VRNRDELYNLTRDALEIIMLPNGAQAVIYKRSCQQIKQYQGGLKDKDPPEDVILFSNQLLPELSLPEALQDYDLLR